MDRTPSQPEHPAGSQSDSMERCGPFPGESLPYLVIDEPEGKRTPVGIITDRDIVVSVIAMKLDPAMFTVGDMVMQEVITIREDVGVWETIQQMRMHGVRRLPVRDHNGGLVGIVSVDDLIQLLAEEMGALARLVSQQQAREAELKR
jgi:CBS domain-containing protein